MRVDKKELSIRLERTTYNYLESKASELGLKPSSFVVMMIHRYLNSQNFE